MSLTRERARRVFDPTRDHRLRHWFDATRVNEGGGRVNDGDDLGAWANLCSRGVNPSAGGTEKPLWDIDGRRGMPVVVFDGTDDGFKVDNGDTAPWGTIAGPEFTIVWCGAVSDVSMRRVLVSGRVTGATAGGFSWCYESSATVMRAYDAGGVGDLGTYTVKAGWQVNHIRVKSGLWAAGQNGRDITTANLGTVSLTNPRTWLGIGEEDLSNVGGEHGASWFSGSMGEILIYAGPGTGWHGQSGFLDDAYLRQVVNYLIAKWGIDP